ncbi:uncharacterized protein LOC115074322 [Rhinatrema bivittatum]|uniref:uncharacterized protein LOC115074322 n=1 Tax=Rhinatrema bivittatum TaxID=194408 RepID=UPI001127C451|nr:uncharacterized protein LOC115074322 [Rhinatrema bivittatum]
MFLHGRYRRGGGSGEWEQGHNARIPHPRDVECDSAIRSWGDWGFCHEYERSRERRGFREYDYRERRGFREYDYRERRNFQESDYSDGNLQGPRNYEDQHYSYQKKRFPSDRSYESPDNSHRKRAPPRHYKTDAHKSVRNMTVIPSQADSSSVSVTEGKDPEKKHTGDKKTGLKKSENTIGGEEGYAAGERAEEKGAWYKKELKTSTGRGGSNLPEEVAVQQQLPASTTEEGGEKQALVSAILESTIKGGREDGAGEEQTWIKVLPESTIGGEGDAPGDGEKRTLIKTISESTREGQGGDGAGTGEKQAEIKVISESTIAEGGSSSHGDGAGEKRARLQMIPESIIEGGKGNAPGDGAGEKRARIEVISACTIKGGGGDVPSDGTGEKRARIEMLKSTTGDGRDRERIPVLIQVTPEEERVTSSTCQPYPSITKDLVIAKATRDPLSVAVLARKEAIELAYQQDCRAFVFVASMLLQKEPSMQTSLVSALRASLREMGTSCVHELRNFIESYDVTTAGHNTG